MQNMLIDIQVAKSFIDDPSSVDLNTAEGIDASAAKILASYGGNILNLNALSGLTEEVASALAGFKGALALNGLKTISEEAVLAFSTSRIGHLSLNGLNELTPPIAAALGNYFGELELNGITRLSREAASALAAPREREWQKTNYDWPLPNTICLGSLKCISPATARILNTLYCPGVISSKLDLNALSIRNYNYTPVTEFRFTPAAQIQARPNFRAGQFYADDDGRFFILDVRDVSLSTYYETGNEIIRSATELATRNLRWDPRFPASIEGVRVRLDRHSIERSDNPFYDLDWVAEFEHECNLHAQLTAIRNSARERKAVLDSKTNALRHGRQTFVFGMPPALPKSSPAEVRKASHRLMFAEKCRRCAVMTVLCSYIIWIFSMLIMKIPKLVTEDGLIAAILVPAWILSGTLFFLAIYFLYRLIETFSLFIFEKFPKIFFSLKIKRDFEKWGDSCAMFLRRQKDDYWEFTINQYGEWRSHYYTLLRYLPMRGGKHGLRIASENISRDLPERKLEKFLKTECNRESWQDLVVENAHQDYFEFKTDEILCGILKDAGLEDALRGELWKNLRYERW